MRTAKAPKKTEKRKKKSLKFMALIMSHFFIARSILKGEKLEL